jgi:hypothetical protein
MAYVTGSVGNAASLRDAIVSAATANGWTWDSGLGALHKGSVAGQLTVSGLGVLVKAALGVSAGALVSPSAITCGIRAVFTVSPHVNLTYPLTYHIFINENPDEVVVAVNYQTSWWQWLGFGMARPMGDNTTPVWQWGTCGGGMTNTTATWDGVAFNAGGTTYTVGNTRQTGCYPFWQAAGRDASPAWCAIYSQLITPGWAYPHVGESTSALAGSYNFAVSRINSQLLQTQPNNWNGETVLLQITVNIGRPSSFNSYLAEIGHLRMVRNDNLLDGQILTLGSEEWFTAPAYRKNLTHRDGASSTDGTHSGTMGIAVRKT